MERVKVNRVGRDFPIVCVGGSAGGLDAYIRLLQNLPNNMGVAIVIVNHMRTLATGLEAFIASTGADEVIVASAIFEPVARLRSCELLAGACL